MQLPYQSFEKVTKKDWIARIEQDLKDGRKYKDLISVLESDLLIEPAIHLEDRPSTLYERFHKLWKNLPEKSPEYVAFFPQPPNSSLIEQAKQWEMHHYCVDYRLQRKTYLALTSLSSMQTHYYEDPLSLSLYQGIPPQNLAYQHTIAIFADLWAELQLTSAQQLAFTLAVIRYYQQQQWLPNQLNIFIALRRNFLVEIAKVRTLRLLIKTLFPRYPVILWVRNALSDVSRQHAHLNLVRTTIAMLAGVLAGADGLIPLPYSLQIQPDNPDAYRYAYNILHLLHYESHLTRLKDALQGAYAIEQLCTQLYRKAQEYLRGLPPEPLVMQEKLQRFLQEQTTTQQRPYIGVNRYPVEEATTYPPYFYYPSRYHAAVPAAVLAELY